MLLRSLNTDLSTTKWLTKLSFAYRFEVLKDLQENLIDFQQKLIKAVTYIYNLDNNSRLEKHTYIIKMISSWEMIIQENIKKLETIANTIY